jgi:hypothetical protein
MHRHAACASAYRAPSSAKGLDADTAASFETSLQGLRDDGATIVDIGLDHAAQCIAVYYIIATAEASANLARFDGVRYSSRAPQARDVATMYERSRTEGFGTEVKRRILLGTFVLSSGYYDAYYRRAQKVRTLICRDFDAAFARCDISPCRRLPGRRFRIGERIDDPLQMYSLDIFTVPANLAGLPGDLDSIRHCARPCGRRAAVRARRSPRRACCRRRTRSSHGCNSASGRACGLRRRRGVRTGHRPRGARAAAHRDKIFAAAAPASVPHRTRRRARCARPAGSAAGAECPRRRVRGAHGDRHRLHDSPRSIWARKNYFYPTCRRAIRSRSSMRRSASAAT